MELHATYLEAFTDEKLYIVAGPEFQELEGYILIFLKALYGLKSSGKRWAEVIHGILRDMKFLPSKADPCIWLRNCRFFGAYRLEFSSSIRQLVGLGGLFCQLNVTEQESLDTTI